MSMLVSFVLVSIATDKNKINGKKKWKMCNDGRDWTDIEAKTTQTGLYSLRQVYTVVIPSNTASDQVF